MKEFVFVVLLVCLSNFVSAKLASPKVQVYSRNPGEFGKPNVLICHVSGFHPPEIRIDLLRNKEEIPGSEQTDLAFEENWHYHLTKHVPFTPKEGDKFLCRVTHMGNTNTFEWESDM
ncbi:beta-2-microglobulin [Austrofundulus limnaeus]|uniref:Beta-2-microglobulin n=1 Tax=Austrofundulus limnaeus TaxID=52670 RepID=A0A2I4CPT3_AUSLI|nr:PREDICTED: beta-2-microglobulin-like [Austrofundulus limnaeus]